MALLSQFFQPDDIYILDHESTDGSTSGPGFVRDNNLKILDQRFNWYFNPAYSKPLLAREPMFWHGGLHARVDGQTHEDPGFFLLHIHRVDYDICLHRHRQRNSLPWNQRDVDENWGYQNRITQDEQFRKWFYEDSCSGVPINVELIPEYWRGRV